MIITLLNLTLLLLAASTGMAAPNPERDTAAPIERRYVNGPCTGEPALNNYDYGKDGICISTSTCDNYKGSYITGGCPSDRNEIKCCVIGESDSWRTNPCGGSSFCTWTGNGCPGGSFHAGYCPGGDDYQCCRHN